MKLKMLFVLISFGILGIVACKKKEVALLSVKDGLVGSWKLQLQGSDLNNNSKFDSEEKNQVLDTAKFSFQLIKGGAGFRIGANNSYVDTMDWVLYNYESTLHFAIYDKGFTNNLYYKFENGSNTLLLLDTTVSPVFFRYFQREN